MGTIVKLVDKPSLLRHFARHYSGSPKKQDSLLKTLTPRHVEGITTSWLPRVGDFYFSGAEFEREGYLNNESSEYAFSYGEEFSIDTVGIASTEGDRVAWDEDGVNIDSASEERIAEAVKVAHAYFVSKRTELLNDPKYRGKFIAVIGSRIVGSDTDEAKLALRVETEYPRIVTLVAKI